jgi:hypothetical protein
MGLFANMAAKRKQKIADTAAAHFGPGETAGAAAICQSHSQALRAVFGMKPYEQYLATATDQNFYVFAISPIKNEVFDEGFAKQPVSPLDARMEKSSAVIGDYNLAPMQHEKGLGDLVEFVQGRNA